ncbi:ferredoxin [uncultured Sphingosinicella sp.]|uniref:ferredoxin n=1 Tax=uncultured Sphingosinicella sp. TaxID=478748 RepID=UPI0030DDD6DB|tara:strand:+ start:44892 stop:45086 length:195 start_codon:yes stop_codon:yes gene_type:complete
MKIKVHHSMCQGHARCYSLAPDIFQLDDAGYILPGDITVPAGQEALAQRGVRACPERALEVAED